MSEPSESNAASASGSGRRSRVQEVLGLTEDDIKDMVINLGLPVNERTMSVVGANLTDKEWENVDALRRAMAYPKKKHEKKPQKAPKKDSKEMVDAVLKYRERKMKEQQEAAQAAIQVLQEAKTEATLKGPLAEGGDIKKSGNIGEQ